VLTADEVADFLRLDRKTICDCAGRGVIPSKRIGKRLLFSRAAIELWLRSCSKGSSESDSE
jgi:excisionase family DNA binding protein